MSEYRISSISSKLGLSADTLRYYEKIGLLPKINRTHSGIRVYNDKDISRLKFIQRSQKMNFSLAEIKKLLSMRENPQQARKDVKELTQQKLLDVKTHLTDLKTLHSELTLLVNLCGSSEDGCPIIETLDNKKKKKSKLRKKA